MIAYYKSKKEFLADIDTGSIDEIIADIVGNRPREMESWKNSLEQMGMVLTHSQMPDDVSIAIEFRIPKEAKRVDFIITGLDKNSNEIVVLIELKQWTKVEVSNEDAQVLTALGRGLHLTSHPSYQVWTYQKLLEGFNEVVYNDDIRIVPCAYLHNYTEDDNITNSVYQQYIEQAPLFFKEDRQKFRNYLDNLIIKKSPSNIIKRIDESKIAPTKKLSDNIASMMKGNKEFVMIGKQKEVYSELLKQIDNISTEKKNVIIVEGGPGTGKSVLAINLLVDSIKHQLNSRYITANGAPRAVYASKLTGTIKKTEMNSLFTGSGSYINSQANDYDLLIVDESHRLSNKNPSKHYLGESQIKDIVNASNYVVFFLDENQIVTYADKGSISEIKKWANHYGADITTLKLDSQFRCNGSSNYLDWLDGMLEITQQKVVLDVKQYEFKIFDSPIALQDAIEHKNKLKYSARIVAGYCWDWVSKKEDKVDIVFPEYNFSMKWNLTQDGNLWIIKEQSIKEAGCIHTCQGLELDYVGVIVGKDIIYTENHICTNPSQRASTDISLKGYKKELKEAQKNGDNEKIDNINKRLDLIIKNTYRTLMTRGMKGCYVYFEDNNTEDYFKSILASSN